MIALFASLVLAAPPPTLESISAEALHERITAPAPTTRVFNFWATWCGPCITEIPELMVFARDHPEIDVVLVNVDLISLRDKTVLPFLQKHQVSGVTSLQLDDPDPASALRTAVDGWPDSVPTTLIVDSKGKQAALLTTAVTADSLAQTAGIRPR